LASLRVRDLDRQPAEARHHELLARPRFDRRWA
jgi:hypothetical protein